MADDRRSSPTVIVTRRALPGRDAEVARWMDEIVGAAAQFPGHLGAEVQPPSSAHPEEWVTVYRFDTQHHLDQWLGSERRRALVRQGSELTDGTTREQRVATPLEAGHAVTAVMSQRILPQHLAGFREAEADIAAEMARFPGFVSIEHAPPVERVQDDYVISFTFSSREDLDRWLESSSRRDVLRRLEPFVTGQRTLSVVGGFGGWFSSDRARQPTRWKQAVVVLIALFPTTLSLGLIQRAFFTGVPWIPALFVSNVVGIVVLTWLLMPRLTRLFAGWLGR